MLKYSIIFSLLFINSCSENSLKSKPSDSKKESKIISDSTNILDKKVQTLELQYTAWGCACPNWVTPSDVKEYSGDTAFLEHHIYIEPENSSIYNPENDSTFKPIDDKIVITGQFYILKDYPKGTIETEEYMPKAKVFRYIKITRVKKP